jgi:hypothetical protein
MGTPSGYGQNIDEERRMRLNFKSWWVYRRVLGLQEITTWAPDGNQGAN